MKTKAGLKALRESAGLSQQSLADALNVTVQSVKRWEHESKPNHAPKDAWDVVGDALSVQRQAVEFAVAKVHEVERDTGRPPGCIPITYYRDQHMFDEFGRDAGYYGRANATARAIGAALQAAGYAVEYRYPQEGAISTPGN